MIIITSPPAAFKGQLTMPGDKSITHRAVIFGALANGVTEVNGFLDADDCQSTLDCLQSLGVVYTVRCGSLVIQGRGMDLKQPRTVLDAGNSGTTARLLLGVLAGQSFSVTITGDESLQKRPMKRVVEPLRLMGAVVEGEGSRLPLTIRGGKLKALSYRSPQASAQVKSAILLAGLYADGITSVEEPYTSRNHTELMLAQFGANIQVTGNKVSVGGGSRLEGTQVWVPGDISSAAFFMVAAAIIPGSQVLLQNVGINPTRSGIIDLLREMGADIELREQRFWGQEPVADILVRGGAPLKAISVRGEQIPRVIDEIPVLAVAAAVAAGTTIISDAAELRVKEADRITALTGQLTRLGVKITETEDGMFVEGGSELTGAEVESCGDHRIAMALAVAGLVAQGKTTIRDAEVVGISFPGFMAALHSLIPK
ncbi:MAG TPA: 3-phosphoshikimate 1-carboxyvinyltransferase [Candidatus Limnocylindrales bacterium]|nr:3-phosphoshikimate 1-carboxyvinyltransferase [Candidatus Limnocylindrales bacterium]